MIKPITISEQLLFSTVRIEATGPKGIASGTGFFFNFKADEKRIIPTIIANKHLIKDAILGKFYVHEAETSDNPQKPSNQSFQVTIPDFEKAWVLHPNQEIDLCAMPFAQLINEAEKVKKIIFHLLV